jgi:hypothetical protein
VIKFKTVWIIKKLSYAAVTKNNILLVNPKDEIKSVDKIEQVRQDIRKKINPAQMGVGLSMGKTTKSGAELLNCSTEKNVDYVKKAIQDNFGQNYEVIESKKDKYRIRIHNVYESEHSTENERIVQKIIRQNELNADYTEIRIVYKSKVVKKKFNIILEVNKYTYEYLMKRDKINIGWSRCNYKQDYGVIRCFNCSKYGHMATTCEGKKVCPICSEDHSINECNTNVKKCINCCQANKRFKTTLDTNHEVWNKECTVLSRIIESQKKKYNSTI